MHDPACISSITCISQILMTIFIGCPTSGVTTRHERGCAACPRREQGKETLRRLTAVKTDKLFAAFSLSPFSGKMTLSLGI
jgi:hypothetical protein